MAITSVSATSPYRWSHPMPCPLLVVSSSSRLMYAKMPATPREQDAYEGTNSVYQSVEDSDAMIQAGMERDVRESWSGWRSCSRS